MLCPFRFRHPTTKYAPFPIAFIRVPIRFRESNEPSLKAAVAAGDSGPFLVRLNVSRP